LSEGLRRCMYPRYRLSRRSRWLEHNQCRSLSYLALRFSTRIVGNPVHESRAAASCLRLTTLHGWAGSFSPIEIPPSIPLGVADRKKGALPFRSLTSSLSASMLLQSAPNLNSLECANIMCVPDGGDREAKAEVATEALDLRDKVQKASVGGHEEPVRTRCLAKWL
jgi:hypothetical protein